MKKKKPSERKKKEPPMGSNFFFLYITKPGCSNSIPKICLVLKREGCLPLKKIEREKKMRESESNQAYIPAESMEEERIVPRVLPILTYRA